jgi:CMP-N-acetylneuraminic acid synthetase
MVKNLKIISIIPARSNSKRVKNKNIINFRNKPLMAHTILHSIQSKYINRTIVSTDSQAYANIAKSYGAEILFLRPKNISRDNSTDLQCFNHCLNFLKIKENYIPDIIVHLRPTYPIRSKGLIDSCIRKLLSKKKYHLLKTICKSEIPIEKMWYMRKNKEIYNPITKNTLKHSLPDQSLNQSYCQNGSVDVIRIKYFSLKQKKKNKILGFLMKENFDINTYYDVKKINRKK